MDNTISDVNQIKRLWWLHDSYWHATMVREFGAETANRLNLEAAERFFRKYTLMMLKSGRIKRPQSINDLVDIFRVVWADCFFDEMYLNEPITIEGNQAVWIGTRCHAYNSLTAGKMNNGYACGCQAIRNGVMKALRLKPSHSIEESLIAGDGRCVVRFAFEPKPLNVTGNRGSTVLPDVS